MFATIRRYTPATGTFKDAEMDQLRRQIHDEFLPLIREVSGFHGYYAVSAEGGELVTVSVFETRAGAVESTRLAQDYVARTPLPVQLNPPEVSQGEIVTYAEAVREVGAH
jgi:hypothetical protein